MTQRILFVEKDLTTADLLASSLERKGYEVAVASTQRQATSKLRSFHPDLLIVDIASFGPKGYHLCDMARHELEGVPCIFLVEGRHVSVDGAAEEFLVPPFTSRRLLYRVKKVVQNLQSHELRAGPLVLDLRTRMLRNGDAAHRLRPKEAELLAIFMRSAGKVITRKELMRAVWQTEYMGDTRTLSVHIRWLRLKIEPDAARPIFLRTVRGVGYRFDVTQRAP